MKGIDVLFHLVILFYLATYKYPSIITAICTNSLKLGWATSKSEQKETAKGALQYYCAQHVDIHQHAHRNGYICHYVHNSMPRCRGSVPGCVVDPLQLNIQKRETTNEPRVPQHPRYVYGSWLRVRTVALQLMP
jgi:hypothetical protein